MSQGRRVNGHEDDGAALGQVCPYYAVRVSAGRKGAEAFVSDFTWEGCS
jgi:hypothetical protein